MAVRIDSRERYPWRFPGARTERGAFRQRIRGKVSEEVYDSEMALMKAERTWLTEEMERHQGKLDELDRLAVT